MQKSQTSLSIIAEVLEQLRGPTIKFSVAWITERNRNHLDVYPSPIGNTFLSTYASVPENTGFLQV